MRAYGKSSLKGWPSEWVGWIEEEGAKGGGSAPFPDQLMRTALPLHWQVTLEFEAGVALSCGSVCLPFLALIAIGVDRRDDGLSELAVLRLEGI